MAYLRDHQTLLSTKYISCGPHGFPHYKSMGAIDPLDRAHSDPRCMDGKIRGPQDIAMF